MEPRNSLKWARHRFLSKAFEIFKDPKKLSQLVKDVEGKINAEYFKKQFKAIWEDLKLLLSLLKDTARGKYKPQSKKNVVLMILALLYFLNPFDLIPDLLVGGFIDDAALLAWVLAKVKNETDNYKSEKFTEKPVS
ncbi:MAG: YkvA family protein [Halobacteriovoraceae bacterium]|nr:YkvA family protein [Halobacteriovoraceae bacterium]